VKTRGYQILLAAAIGVCVLLAIALGYVLLRRDHAAPQTTAQDPVVARGPEMNSQPTPAQGGAPNADPSFAPRPASRKPESATGLMHGPARMTLLTCHTLDATLLISWSFRTHFRLRLSQCILQWELAPFCFR
jgi:hypothetical protein